MSLFQDYYYYRAEFVRYFITIIICHICILYYVLSGNEELKERIFEWLPEFSIVYALPILARDPDFTEINYLTLKRMEKYLWPFLQLIVEKSNFNCSILFRKIGEKLKSFGDAQSSELNEVRTFLYF